MIDSETHRRYFAADMTAALPPSFRGQWRRVWHWLKRHTDTCHTDRGKLVLYFVPCYNAIAMSYDETDKKLTKYRHVKVNHETDGCFNKASFTPSDENQTVWSWSSDGPMYTRPLCSIVVSGERQTRHQWWAKSNRDTIWGKLRFLDLSGFGASQARFD